MTQLSKLDVINQYPYGNMFVFPKIMINAAVFVRFVLIMG